MFEATAPSSVETTKSPERLESPLPNFMQVQILQEIGDVIVGPGSINQDNAAGIGKCLIQDDFFRKRIIQEAKKRIFVGRAVTDRDFDVINSDGSYQDTTLAKLMQPSAEFNRLHLIDGLSTQEVEGEERIALNIRKTEGKEEMTYDSIQGRVLADILKVVLFDEDAEINDNIV